MESIWSQIDWLSLVNWIIGVVSAGAFIVYCFKLHGRLTETEHNAKARKEVWINTIMHLILFVLIVSAAFSLWNVMIVPQILSHLHLN